jgi:hypothetical protein
VNNAYVENYVHTVDCNKTTLYFQHDFCTYVHIETKQDAIDMIDALQKAVESGYWK